MGYPNTQRASVPTETGEFLLTSEYSLKKINLMLNVAEKNFNKKTTQSLKLHQQNKQFKRSLHIHKFKKQHLYACSVDRTFDQSLVFSIILELQK